MKRRGGPRGVRFYKTPAFRAKKGRGLGTSAERRNAKPAEDELPSLGHPQKKKNQKKTTLARGQCNGQGPTFSIPSGAVARQIACRSCSVKSSPRPSPSRKSGPAPISRHERAHHSGSFAPGPPPRMAPSRAALLGTDKNFAFPKMFAVPARTLSNFCAVVTGWPKVKGNGGRRVPQGAERVRDVGRAYGRAMAAFLALALRLLAVGWVRMRTIPLDAAIGSVER